MISDRLPFLLEPLTTSNAFVRNDKTNPNETMQQSPEWKRESQIIEAAWQQRHERSPGPEAAESIERILAALNGGLLRAAVPQGPGEWTAIPWIMYAVILSFGCSPKELTRIGSLTRFDQPDKFAGMTQDHWRQKTWRVLLGASVRYGVFMGERVFLMPSFVSTGVWIDDDSMIDGMANVGTCAQIGRRVHVSAGVSIGGVAEPLQARPVIIEDDCFIGANCSILEGALIEEGSVIGPGVHLTGSTKILNRLTGEVGFGRVPAGSVVIAGTMPSRCGTHQLACGVIVKQADARTREKVAITAAMRA